MGIAGDKLLAKLRNQHDEWIDDFRGRSKSGILYKAEVWLKDIQINYELDQDVGGMHIEKFVIIGKFESYVRKEYYSLGIHLDSKWGNNNKPYGSFTINAKAIDGAVAMNGLNTSIDNYNDGPNRHAAKYVRQLIKNALETLS